jgi:hypothetical protein
MRENEKIKKELGCLKAYREKSKEHEKEYTNKILGDKPKEGEY